MTSGLLAKLESRAPRVLNSRAILILNAYGLLLMLPALFAIALVSVIRLSWWSVIIPVLAVLVSLLLLPFGFGNLSLARWVRRFSNNPAGFAVQARLTPKRRSITRAMLEDADDVGVLEATDHALVYRGDALDLTIPSANIVSVHSRNIGWRGFFLYGNRCIVRISGMPDISEIEFSERQSLLTPQSWVVSRKMNAAVRSVGRRTA